MFQNFPAVVCCIAVALSGCDRKGADSKAPARPVVRVVTAEVIRKDVPLVVQAIGRVSSPSTVSVKPQVTGPIADVHFTDGQAVRKGQPLFTIDTRPFEVALEQAVATRAEAEAKAENARDAARRYESLGKTGTVSKEQAADYDVAAKAAEATVQVAEAAVKSAKLQLEYCVIRASIDGRPGKALVTAGNVVTANQTDLVIVNQIAPVEVTFSVAEQQLKAVQQSMANGKPKVSARTSGADRQSADGELVFVDNAVKAASGTIELKAAFPNEPQVLWPGQFVSLRVTVSVGRDAVVAPAAAVQSGQDSAFVFLIKADKTAEIRKIVVERTFNEDAVIRSGLEGGETIVIDGQSRLTSGSKVEAVPPVAEQVTEPHAAMAKP